MENTQLKFEAFCFDFGKYKERDVAWIRFEKDFTLIRMLKNYAKAFWSKDQVSWYVYDNNFDRDLFKLQRKIIGKQTMAQIHPINLQAFENLQNEIILRGFSKNTLRSYSTEFAQLLYTIKDYPVENLTTEKLKSYLLYCINELGLSENYLHSRIKASKFFFEKVLKREKKIHGYSPSKKARNTAQIFKHLRNCKNY